MRTGLAASALLVAAAPVAAHPPGPGLEGFNRGLWHPVTTPDQALTVLALVALVVGTRPQHVPGVLSAVAVGLVAGLTLGTASAEARTWLFTLAAPTAALAALAPGRVVPAACALAAAAGGLLGWASLPDPGPAVDRAFTAAGAVTGVACALLTSLGALDVLRARGVPHWIGIAGRVLAAWVAAIAVLMAALAVATAPVTPLPPR